MTRSGSSARTLCFGGLLLGGGLGVVAAAQPWWRAVGQDVSVKFSGQDVTAGLSQALAVVTLAGALLILVLRSRGRRVVGMLLSCAGLGIAVVGALRVRPSSDAVLTQVREVSLANQFALVPTPWPWVYAVAGVLVVIGAVLTVLTAARWPVRADRFTRTERPVQPVSASDEPADVWKALDAGMDPTVDPDVRSDGIQDTIEPDRQSSQSSRSAE